VQQSAVVVQDWPTWTQAAVHCPFTHGVCVPGPATQQSALVAQVPPAFATHEAWSAQRGIPSASLRQQAPGLLLQLPSGMSAGSQQLFGSWQLSIPCGVLQSMPGWRQLPPGLHRPNSSPAPLLHFV
jgi:hypothetical protein